jgi:hypothetical protein
VDRRDGISLTNSEPDSMTEPYKRNVCIEPSYWIRGSDEQTCSASFDRKSLQMPRIGLPDGKAPVKVSKRVVIYSFVVPILKSSSSLEMVL